MRCFISVNIPEEVKKEIKKIQDKLPGFYGKKTELENLHLTLKFLGELDEEKIEGIKKRLREIKFKKVETRVKYSGFFDNQKYGVVWLHLTNCDRLQKEVDEKLKDLFDKEKRFMGHLTIARVKKIRDKKEFLKKLKAIKTPEIGFVVESFYLMKSDLTGDRPKYSSIGRYELI